jgi:hypothetical protein
MGSAIEECCNARNSEVSNKSQLRYEHHGCRGYSSSRGSNNTKPDDISP